MTCIKIFRLGHRRTAGAAASAVRPAEAGDLGFFIYIPLPLGIILLFF